MTYSVFNYNGVMFDHFWKIIVTVVSLLIDFFDLFEHIMNPFCSNFKMIFSISFSISEYTVKIKIFFSCCVPLLMSHPYTRERSLVCPLVVSSSAQDL